ncbi:MAG: hypothetical protein J6Q70_07530 [Clostridia bacterium]|nr:hypothetical protein [Clostridia bacterium]
MKRIISTVLLCAVLLLCCACTPALKKEENGGFRNPQTDICYYPAPLNYYAKPYGEEPYARIKLENGGEDVLLYPIEGADPEKYLVSDGYTVYCAVGAELPELSGLSCVRVGIYDTQVSSNDGNVTAAAEIAALKELYATGAFTSLNNVGLYITDTTNWYDLHFFGDGAYKGVYYQLKYGVFDEDVIITELVEKDANGHYIDIYPGVPYEIITEVYEGKEYTVAKYNFGKEIMCDMTTGNCYMIEDSLLSYVTPTGE